MQLGAQESLLSIVIWLSRAGKGSSEQVLWGAAVGTGAV